MTVATRRRPSGHPAVPTEPLVGVEPMAALLGVHHLTLRKMIKRGEVPYFTVGNQYRFDPAAVLAALQGGR